MKQKISLPIEIWYMVLDNYQYLIKINHIDPYKIHNQKKQQYITYGSNYWKLKFIDNDSYSDIENIALVNLAFYKYCFYNIFNINWQSVYESVQCRSFYYEILSLIVINKIRNTPNLTVFTSYFSCTHKKYRKRP